MADSPPSSSFSRSRWKYDVFLSFRGEDTRKIFVSHLYKALCDKGIMTFKDDEVLPEGNQISLAIQESRVLIVVFSEHYASSRWCLKELVQISACMDTEKQMVVPIFYQVDPSDVSEIKRSFGEAFGRYENDPKADMEEVKSWRSALTRAANLPGWASQNYDNDAILVHEIVTSISRELFHVSSSKANGLVGMESRIAEINSLLCLGVDDVRVVGIWGIGGIGKTTLATAVYKEISCQFEACCFLQNMREAFMEGGAVKLQELLLSSILKEKIWKFTSSESGNLVITKKMLGNKKILLVLDDVDNIAQIKALLGVEPRHLLRGGSRIIITSRDKHLLIESRVDAIYFLQPLDYYGSLALFRQDAFQPDQQTADYDHLSRRVIEYAEGLPLALKVLGQSLYGRPLHDWETLLERIKRKPSSRDITNVLKISFDGLDVSEKELFLDIACFFGGMNKDYVSKILDSCGRFPQIGLQVLLEKAPQRGLQVLLKKAFITISDRGTLEMHSLLKDMGREIVHQECPVEPGKRSRLWHHEDVLHVLTENTGTNKVRSISWDLSNSEGECIINSEAFTEMQQLRLLKIDYGHHHLHCNKVLCEELEYLPPSLRCLIWHGCPLKSFPSAFHPDHVVDLNLQYSQLEELWAGTEALERLKFINLSHSHSLKKTPDLTQARYLAELILDGCVSLLEVHPSISSLGKLVILSLKGCTELQIFPSSISMRSLKTLDLSRCLKLKKFPEISEDMKELSELYIDETAVKELPSSINNLTGLVRLSLEGCQELLRLPSSIHLSSLRTLKLSGCSKLKKFPEILEGMEELSELYLDEIAIEELPSSINNLTGLVTLSLKGCRELESLTNSIHMTSLKSLVLSGCLKFKDFPEISGDMDKLSELYLDGTAIKELPLSTEKLKGLTTLTLDGCKALMTLPVSILEIRSLAFTMSGCTMFQGFK